MYETEFTFLSTRKQEGEKEKKKSLESLHYSLARGHEQIDTDGLQRLLFLLFFLRARRLLF